MEQLRQARSRRGSDRHGQLRHRPDPAGAVPPEAALGRLRPRTSSTNSGSERTAARSRTSSSTGPPYRPARILVANRNFGCGSSREHAVWALYDYGFRVVIAPSFGDIFLANSLKNGLLPIVLPQEVVSAEIARLEANPGATIFADLDEQKVRLSDGSIHGFEVDPFAKSCLTKGVDELGYTLERLAHDRRFRAPPRRSCGVTHCQLTPCLKEKSP